MAKEAGEQQQDSSAQELEQELFERLGQQVPEDPPALEQKPPEQKPPEQKPPALEQKPPEQKPPEPGPSIEEEEEEEYVPEGITDPKAREAFYRQRRKWRVEREKRIAAEARMEGARDEHQEGADRAARLTPQQRAENNIRVLDYIALAEQRLRGELVEGMEEETKAREINQAGRAALAEMTPEDIADALEAIRAGGAKVKADRDLVMALAREQLPLAQVRVDRERRMQQAAAAAARKAWARVYEKYPQLKPPEKGGADTPERVFIKEWMEKNVGTLEKPGWLMAAAHADPAAVERVMDMAMRDYTASSAEKLRADRDKLARVVEGRRTPAAGGHPAPEGKAQAGTSKDIEAELIQEAGITVF